MNGFLAEVAIFDVIRDHEANGARVDLVKVCVRFDVNEENLCYFVGNPVRRIR